MLEARSNWECLAEFEVPGKNVSVAIHCLVTGCLRPTREY